MRNIYQLFPALAHRSFFYFIIGQTISMLGLWMQRLAMSWLVFRLTGSAFLLSIVEFVSLAPVLVLGLMAGAFLERHELRRSLITTQALCMAEAVLLTFVTFTGIVNYPLLVLLSLGLGIITPFDMTARQSSVSLMVSDQNAVKSAVALNSMAFNISKLVGPSIAGFVIYLWGEGICFLVSALAYLPILFLLAFRVRLRERVLSPHGKNMLGDIIEGLRHVQKEFFLNHIFRLLAVFNLVCMCYSVLFPMFATAVLGGNSQTLGWLFGAVGGGAFVGGIFVSVSLALRRVPLMLVRTTAITALGLIVFSLSENLWLSLAAAFCVGFGITTANICVNTLCQVTSSDDWRSRVLSLYIMCTTGLGPVGELAAGAVADMAGAPASMIACALVICAALVMFLRHFKAIHHSLSQALARM